ncbi:MAG: hypothetical protein R3B51_12680 [Thermodesulfobacteriota bacterium]
MADFRKVRGQENKRRLPRAQRVFAGSNAGASLHSRTCPKWSSFSRASRGRNALYGRLLDNGVRVIDFSADFRFKDAALYEDLYKAKHRLPQYIDDAVYGIPEIFREGIRGARLVANPGCYARRHTRGSASPEGGLVDETSIIADAKSG